MPHMRIEKTFTPIWATADRIIGTRASDAELRAYMTRDGITTGAKASQKIDRHLGNATYNLDQARAWFNEFKDLQARLAQAEQNATEFRTPRFSADVATLREDVGFAAGQVAHALAWAANEVKVAGDIQAMATRYLNTETVTQTWQPRPGEGVKQVMERLGMNPLDPGDRQKFLDQNRGKLTCNASMSAHDDSFWRVQVDQRYTYENKTTRPGQVVDKSSTIRSSEGTISSEIDRLLRAVGGR